MSQTAGRPQKAYVETYGCQMNMADGELMQGILAAGGYLPAASPEDADVILVNTCAIRDHAEQRVLGRVGELYRIKRDRPEVVIGVTGCMAQRMGESLLERAPYVDLVMGPDNYRGLPDLLGKLRPAGAPAPVPNAAEPKRRSLPVISLAQASESIPERGARVAALDFAAHENYEDLEVSRASGISAWIPVQRGCDYRCTYCIVPYVRGSEKNRAPDRILEEVRRAVGDGLTEVVLLGQTVNSYEHEDWRFPRLLREVARISGVRRVRFTSPHPNDFTRELVDVMATEPAVCGQLHLPVQSGHNRTLKRMLRRYTVEEYLEKIDWVRTAIPDIALSTDVIVAFPAETDDEFRATLDLMRTVRFDDAYLYKYSVRDGTPATRLPAEQFIPEDVAQARLEELIALHRGIQAEINRAEVGRVVEVLVERAAKSAGDVLGRTDGNKVVAFAAPAERIGQYVKVRLTSTTGSTFHGELAGVDARVA